ncbi:MAG: cytochrome c maturation protein CcmE [Chloroflexota bacterium]
MNADRLGPDQMEIEESSRSPWLNPKLLSAAGIVVLAVAFLIYNAMDGSAAYYMTVEEISTSTEDVADREIKFGGDVKDGSIERGGIGEEIRFEVSDGEHSIPVVYDGDVPDIFSDHAEVIATGQFGDDGVFVAHELLTKCPSRFESDEGVSG